MLMFLLHCCLNSAEKTNTSDTSNAVQVVMQARLMSDTNVVNTLVHVRLTPEH